MRPRRNDRSCRTLVRQQSLIRRVILACFLVGTLCGAAFPGASALQAVDAQKAFDDWVAASEAVKAAKSELKEANESLSNMMAVVASGGVTEAEEAALAKARARVAAAEAALKEAEARRDAARTEFEKAIAELADDDPLKKELIRKRDGYIADQRIASIVKAEVVIASGLRTATFVTPNGSAKVYLPDDMRAGDIISGTVIAEPNGATQEERSKNMSELRAYLVDIVPSNPKPGSKHRSLGSSDLFVAAVPNDNPNQLISVLTFIAPGKFDLNLFFIPNDNSQMGRCSRSGSIAAISESCSPISQLVFSVPRHPSEAVITPDPKITPGFFIPPLGQTGRPVEVIGPFDGNAANTTLNAGAPGINVPDVEKNKKTVSGGFDLLAESPRKAVFSSPADVTGPILITLKEGNTQTTGNYRNVGVRLSAPKTKLLKGERTTLSIEVIGLQGLSEPLPLTLASTGVISMQNGAFQAFAIQPSEVSAEGRYATTRQITGVQPGGWGATATVLTRPFDIVLRDPSPPQTILINSFTGDYAFCGSRFKLTGTGQIKRQGCIIELIDDRPDRLVRGTIDSCALVDGGKLSPYSPGTNTELKITVTDTKPPIRKIYFNPLSKPAPPIQDLSAFASCP